MEGYYVIHYQQARCMCRVRKDNNFREERRSVQELQVEGRQGPLRGLLQQITEEGRSEGSQEQQEISFAFVYIKKEPLNGSFFISEIIFSAR